MKRPQLISALTGSALTGALFLTLGLSAPQDAAPEGMVDMAAMMERAKQYTQPSEHHELLEKFIGKWDFEMRFFMGGQATPAEKGTAEWSWLMEGRWLQQTSKGTMLGNPHESFSVMGYDNFKMSYVAMSVASIDTVMNYAEGDLDPGGKVLIMWGTLDEYLSGEHDKMVKLVWRFESDDKLLLEIHDMPIGEKNTQVVEMTYTRQK